MLGTILIIAGAAIVALGIIGKLMIRRHPEENNDPDKVLDNVADLNDRFNRARYQDKDS